jgi:selenide, water dikinase
VDSAAVPLIEGAAETVRAGYMPGGSRRNLDWVAPHGDFGGATQDMLLLLADAQTSGGLLLAGEIPGAVVIGELIEPGPATLIVR